MPVQKYSSLNPRPLPPIEAVLQAFDFDERQSAFIYKPSERGVSAGRLAGREAAGYLWLYIGGHGSFGAHRLIWKLYNGRDPTGFIDHINGIRYDNRIVNLRDVSASVNNINRHGDLNRRLMVENAAFDRAFKLANIENRERDTLARLKAKYERMEKAT